MIGPRPPDKDGPRSCRWQHISIGGERKHLRHVRFLPLDGRRTSARAVDSRQRARGQEVPHRALSCGPWGSSESGGRRVVASRARGSILFSRTTATGGLPGPARRTVRWPDHRGSPRPEALSEGEEAGCVNRSPRGVEKGESRRRSTKGRGGTRESTTVPFALGHVR
jgi:diadenosine tetraphosphatase ApaH/serine/threonine PP2A family protein phosphatase